MYDLLIKNGHIVNSDRTVAADIAVADGKIVAIGTGLSGKREIDAAGKLVIPGGVDTHVHLSLDLGGDLVSSDDFFTGTRAAALGGTTTVVSFVHPESGEAEEEAFRRRQAEAEGEVAVDYGWHMNIGPGAFGDADGSMGGVAGGAGDRKLRRFVERSLELGIPTFKLYMAYGYELDDVQLFKAIEAVGAAGGMSVVHAENFALIKMFIHRAVAAGESHPRWHEKSRPAIFEAEAARRVISMAEYLSAPLEIFHIGTDLVVDEIRSARRRGFPVYGETCPQYLFLNTDTFERPGVEAAYGVCAPPLREEADRLAMWKALADRGLQIVATDHCPFTHEKKAAGLAGGFSRIPGGVPSMEMRMAGLYSGGVASGLMSENRWVEVCSTAPARLHGFTSKGVLAPGFDADVVIFDPDATWKLRAEELSERCGWSPYEGLELTGRVETTLLDRKSVV
jgi:dihydropyrimidinase